MLLGILDILDPELFLKSCEEPQVLLVGGGHPVPAPPPASVGAPPVKLETLNGLIHFDHIYTKPVEEVGDTESGEDEKIDEEQTEVTEVIVGEETVCVKDEPEEVVILTSDRSPVGDLLSGASPSAFSQLVDTYSDSGYEGSPSPFSDMCSESSWEDMFATELFPQLISV